MRSESWVNYEESIYSQPIVCHLARSLALYLPCTSHFTQPPNPKPIPNINLKPIGTSADPFYCHPTQLIQIMRTVYKNVVVFFYESMTSPWQVLAAPRCFFIVSRTKVSSFLFVPERPVRIQKHSGLKVCKAGAARVIDVTPCQPIKRIVYSLTGSHQIMVLCSHVPSNSVLRILLCVSIIIMHTPVCAFIAC